MSRAEVARLTASIVPVEPQTPLVEVLATDFADSCLNLPITGGWGRSKERPIVFTTLPTGKSLEDMEHLIAKHVIYEELIVFRPFEDRFNGIIVAPISRQRVTVPRAFDCVTVHVTCWPERQWRAMESEVIKGDRMRSPDFDLAAFIATRESWKITYSRAFWFDVSRVAS